jgi:hypothetical protein
VGQFGGGIGLVFALVMFWAALSQPIVLCGALRDAFLVDGLLCMIIAGAEFHDEEEAAEIVAAIASVLFILPVLGVATQHLSC